MITEPTTGLLDDALPTFDVRSRHSRRVAAGPEAVWRAVEVYDLRRDASLPVRALLLLRGLGVPGGTLREALGPSGFTVLSERPGREIVAGTLGKFWAVRELAHMANPEDLDHFRGFDQAGWAKGAVSLRVEPLEDGATNLVTETRVLCLGERARRRFAAYWALIRPFSGGIRRDLLLGIARRAEGEG